MTEICIQFSTTGAWIAAMLFASCISFLCGYFYGSHTLVIDLRKIKHDDRVETVTVKRRKV